MKLTRFLLSIIFSAALLLSGCSTKEITKEETAPALSVMINNFKADFAERSLPFYIPRGSRIDTVIFDQSSKNIDIYLNERFSEFPIRKEYSELIYKSVNEYFGNQYNIKIYSINNILIEELIPNYYRKSREEYDKSRLPVNFYRPAPVVKNMSKPFEINKGLNDKNILLWHSHGWYYSNGAKRWEWQRPRLFQSVEDKVPMSFVLPYLIPMLENAGANVFVPRERDFQVNEVVVDNDSNSRMYSEQILNKNIKWKTGEGPGFAIGTPPYPSGLNPFKQGTYKTILSDTAASAFVNYIPEIPEEGEYGVYISFASSDDNAEDVSYTVYHAGGKTEFKVNQKIGGGTWIWLGKFKFKKGFNPEIGKVVLSNKSRKLNQTITADAVRFGGGMGVVERNGSTSGRPKFLEGSRYWLQYAGMPDTLVYLLNKDRNDYNDDYQSRAEYGNYLYGTPYGPNRDRNIRGLGIPIDISLAFHTDAGITRNDTSVGTLSIYSLESINSEFVFPDSVSRMANRDFADILQTQIVEDVRAKYDPSWTRRELREAQYSENTRPNFPSALLELLSHQNLYDMKFVLDPQFRFDVARAVYKAMLRFLSAQYNFKYSIQPLPVTHFSAEFEADKNIKLRWKPQADPLEPTAAAKSYVIYTRIDDGGFDNGFIVNDTVFTFNNIENGKIYSFKITAVNDGGESFPSEILSVCKNGDSNPVLIVNGFDRISAPAIIETETFSGFMNKIDAGVPDKFLLNFTGEQYDFDPTSPYKSNDAPGHGASHADYETKIIAGNIFDFPFIHGKAIKDAGYSFVSCSDESVIENLVDLKKYKMVDLILGEEKETHWQKSYADSIHGTKFKAFPVKLRDAIADYTISGGNIFISGAYTGTELFSNPSDTVSMQFAANVLKFRLAENHAARTGVVESVSDNFIHSKMLQFNTELNDSIYAVEAPDAINNTRESEMLFRYYENKFGAGVGYKEDYGVVVLGFPFETILKAEDRSELMKSIIRYFNF